jgi:class 3 adenylate cyclase
LVREFFGTHGGVGIDTQGDAFFFAFARARDAVASAVALQRARAGHAWPRNEVVRVRIGLHTGEPAVGEEGYFGLDVVRAARLGAAGNGGEVLLSETTRALLGSAVPDGVIVHPLGERRLEGLDEPERVYALAIAGVEISEAKVESSSEPEVDLERWKTELGNRLGDNIRERVARSLERSFDKLDDRR